MTIKKTVHALTAGILMTLLVFGQLSAQTSHGHKSNRKYGVMDGNLVRAPFINTAKLGSVLGYRIEYPIGSGHQQMDGIAPVIVSRIVDNQSSWRLPDAHKSSS